ncbi:16S rRNA (uracil(1498)-N(3))-methyltransferase [Glutamicibacter sp. JL.03c]|uniref:16S rRNA (uracil(1498)-N(3))-methyltransferase n=1 Tax=Glutamicibacter sp. JL.03c TaxID=2984842 RepID=UPI0021F6EE33|nr:16S rRNA (uracil(1498)-N(3))-methyltransferase [Glutamicibacter sp. JL.03c]UYQ79063.1 16S rRNA (uracil(1498)-N(3))-methyltransferase [Glutamicibacter sp. JL.03c]
MSNHSFVIDPDVAQNSVPGDTLELSGPEAHHAVTVKRVTAGEHLDLLDGQGMRLTVEVLGTGKDLLSARVIQRTQEVGSDHPVTLVQALSKGDRDLQAVESAVELGVLAVRPWQADRSIVRWNSAKTEKALAKWRAQVRSAQKQSRRAFEPEVLAPVSSKELAKAIAADVQAGALVLVLHEQATEAVAAHVSSWLAAAQSGQKVVMIVGPEGGISHAELLAFVDAGAQAALLGQHVLRASTAGPAALVLIRHLLGEL